MNDILFIKRHDLQPYYRAKILDSEGDPVDLTGSSLQATFSGFDGTVVFSLDNARVSVTSNTGGMAECQWQGSDTANAGRFFIEFTVNPSSGGKFTVPVKNEDAVVIILEDKDDG